MYRSNVVEQQEEKKYQNTRVITTYSTHVHIQSNEWREKNKRENFEESLKKKEQSFEENSDNVLQYVCMRSREKVKNIFSYFSFIC